MLNTEITISELAHLMQVSVHQIRYFEEKGILYPAYTADNQYRMYGIDQIYRLSHILLMRKMGLSVQAIRQWTNEGTSDRMEQLLRQSATRIEAEMARLRSLTEFIHKVLEEKASTETEASAYQRVQREVSYLSSWFTIDKETKLDARMLAQQGDTIPELFKTNIHYLYEEGGPIRLCTEARQENGDIVLPEGEYLVYRFSAKGEEDIEHHYERFESYAERHSLLLTGPRMLVEKSYLSLFSQDDIHYEWLARIDRTLQL
ncbi:DNA-binding transcriptional MerR regulator [Paenibacillus phyllosphaerae]|uniref:DNA-binding transcriptional MerR regulator n=1 Tax=Paenibacillus phyllosphaerae TaxID=274593 RepID=A0A7W5FPS7_9BACL|nr:MerR family transcriptional regulator [Paenibacillus phyllosphaerae]MBB3112706.1 DNA-binding transcriptional MerR regulator [Paenibacillus phyllosphaerae]